MRGRTNTMTTTASKASMSTTKRMIGAGKGRPNSDATQTSSSGTSLIVPIKSQVAIRARPVKVITEVDGKINNENISIDDSSSRCDRYEY